MPKSESIEIYAGLLPDGQRVAERLSVEVLEDDTCRLLLSPAFAQGIARGDIIKFDPQDQSFELVRRSGNLCVRVIAREDLDALANDLIPAIEKLGGQCDLETPRMLVFSVHVSCGFQNIEKLLNDHVGEETASMWAYGNVYDPADGITPLNWWQAILKPE